MANPDQHEWSREDDTVAFYLSRHGGQGLPPIDDIGRILGMGHGSLHMRMKNFESLEGQSEEVYRLHKDTPQEELKAAVLDILARTEVIPCPGCANNHVSTGACQSWRGDAASRFEPDDLRWFQPFRLRRSGVKVQGRFQVCLRCGLLWSSVSPEELAALIEKYGTEEAKKRLPGTKSE